MESYEIKKKKTNIHKPITVRVSDKLFSDIKRVKQQKGYSSIPEVIREAIREFLEKQEGTEK
ncbi:MAG: ribbon-helix-helix domain-containing protein [Thermoplasmata archaeon]|jgi:Arc/MetJ-type ribon-helix-helix transcriptional regulator